MHADLLATLPWLEAPPADFRARVHAALADHTETGRTLRQLAQVGMTEAQLHQLGRAFTKARADRAPFPELTPFRLAVLGNATTEHLTHALIATALRHALSLDVLSVSYDEATMAAMARSPRIADFAPDAVLLAMDHRSLPPYDALGNEGAEQEAMAADAQHLQTLLDGLRRHYGAVCIVQSMAVPAQTTFGSYDRRVAGTLARRISAINSSIDARADVVLDVAALATTVGTAQWFDDRLYHSGKIPFALPFVPLYADHVCRVLGAMRGKSRRVLVLDLDNTLWGGVVGDDGVHGLLIGNGTAQGEAFLEVQRKALALRQRGVLLAVSSKNDEDQARRPFRELPGMLLREESFAAFHANWTDKAANMQAIAEELSLGLDSMVFLDDNAAERALVRALLPEVAVPELPADPSGFAPMLDLAGYFEAISFSGEDQRRADLYRSRGTITRLAAHDLSSYLASLDMELEVARVSAKNRTRVVQLINKSNQFNLTTERYTEADIIAMEADARWHGVAFRLRDRLDDHGIISVLLCAQQGDALDIRLWVMSCRVIGRGVERAALRLLRQTALDAGCTRITGSYRPTARNAMVAEHYARLGFALLETLPDGETHWALAVSDAADDDQQPIRITDAD